MLEQLSERVCYAPGGVNIGVIFTPNDGAIMVDTGLNDSAARKVVRDLERRGRRVLAIMTTHGHADHFGGNAFVVRRTGAQVYAPAWDETVLRYPLFQPLVLFAGADPPASLRGNFMLAEQSPVDVVYDAGPLAVAGVELEVVSLAGHSGNQMGVLIDDVFFCADVVFPARVIERYRMPYLYSVRDHLASLARAATVPHRVAVPGHGPLLEPIDAAVELNLALVHKISDMVVEACREPRMPEEVLAELLTRLESAPSDPASFYLLHPTAFAYLTYLEAEGRVSHTIAGGRSLWHAV
jgi:glyoxylase-like metal-dependent hydrolase (beta-lactamase superfamily II)